MNNIDQTNDIYKKLLLEIGTEEIPARFLPDALLRLKENSEALFNEYRLQFDSIKTYATPRRIALLADINPTQEATEVEIWGPPLNVAFDKDGKPTTAAKAFAKTHNINIEDLIKKEKGKGVYLVAKIKRESKKTAEILPELLQRLILSINFPKEMRWGNSNLRFVRPIHWFLALYDNKKVDFEIDGIKSNNMTRGHRYLSPAFFEIKDIRTYINLLRNNFVILDPEERKKMILEGSRRLASSINALMIEDEELLEHVTYLVEYPNPVLGKFPEEYLSLPEELLITVMKDHQKYFGLKRDNGNLINYFIIISNTRQENADTVKAGAEKVIKARFEDARFYFEEDRKTDPMERLEKLKRVIYHDKLGSLYDKSIRICNIANYIADQCLPYKKGDIRTAALLSKTDLISGVVREFPELQGIMGSYYARHFGYNEEVSLALSEQYLPRHSGDRLPKSDIGAIISLSDKLDNIASFFMLGLVPTGNEDPFALRRQAIGIISILIEKKYPLKIDELFDISLNLLNIKNEQLKNDIMTFFEQRIEPFLLSQGYTADCISAVISYVRHDNFYTIKDRVDALQRFKEEINYNEFLLAIKRINNISPKNDIKRVVNPDLFDHEEEKILYEKVQSASQEIKPLIDNNKYFDAIKVMMTLKDTINKFFDKVLVMDKREEIKQNRLALIKSVKTLALRIADFSKLSEK